MRTTDINKDGLDDIYIMNNGEQTVETLYLSPERQPQKNTIKIDQKIKDIFFSNEKSGKLGKVFLLKDGTLFFEQWNKKIATQTKKPKKILLINKNII